MPQYAFILNPAARLGAAARQETALRRAIENAGLDAVCVCTRAPRHAVTLAQELAEKADAVVAVGGDGTVHEVAEGLVAHGKGIPLGVVGLGTGNDFARMLGLPQGLRAVAALETARVVRADYGVVAWEEADQTHHGFFCNGLGAGFDARVAVAAPRYKRLPGVGGYLVAVLDTLTRWQAPHATLALDGVTRFDAPLLLAAIGNGTTAGGGFVLTPEARIADGRLDVCVIRDLPRHQILRLLPQALRGLHGRSAAVQMATFQMLELHTAAPVAIHADGEVLTTATQHLRVHVVAGALPVLAGAEV